MPSSPQWKQRRLAVRAKRVQARRSADAPVIAAYGPTLGLKADAYIAAFDAAAHHETSRKKEVGNGKKAVLALHKQIHAWLPLLDRDIPGFKSSAFDASVETPDDVIEEGVRLLTAIDEGRDENGQLLSYRPEALTAIQTTLEVARTEWGEAEAASTAHQQLLAAVRETGAAFDKELQAFRKSLAKTFGRKDKDYQRLRASRASAPEEGEEQEPEPDQPEEPEDEDPIPPSAKLGPPSSLDPATLQR